MTKRLVAALARVRAPAASRAPRSDGAAPIAVGAIYPLSGAQGPGGIDEHRGVLLAADLATPTAASTAAPIQIHSLDVEGADAAPAAVEALHAAGIDIVLGSYGSTICAPASLADGGRARMLFWETGAVGMLPTGADPGRLTFRVPPTGGRSAATRSRSSTMTSRRRWTATLDPPLRGDLRRRRLRTLGRRRGRAELAARGLHLVGSVGYDLTTFDCRHSSHRIAAPTRRAVRVRVPRGRRRDAARIGAPPRAAAGQHRDVLELLHAGVRRRRSATRRSACSPPTSPARPRSTPPASPRGGRAPAARRHRLPRSLRRRHEPGRARRVLGGRGRSSTTCCRMPPRSPPTTSPRPRSRRTCRAAACPTAAACEFGAAGTARRRRQPRRRRRDLGVGAPRPRRGRVAARVRHGADGPEHVRRMVSRRAGRAAGAVVVVAYVALAAWSGSLSPLSRGPLLDGIGPPQAYNWVNPPPDLAPQNLPPSPGVFTCRSTERFPSRRLRDIGRPGHVWSRRRRSI